MMKFSFKEEPNVQVMTCVHVLDHDAPILYVTHDEEDGMWQFLCGTTHKTEEGRIVSLKNMFDKDQSVGLLRDLPCGYSATRESIHDDWIIEKI